MERFGFKKKHYCPCRFVFDGELAGGCHIGDEEIPNIDVAGTFATAALPVVLQEHCAQVILVQSTILDIIPLMFKEVPGPEYLREDVVDPD